MLKKIILENYMAHKHTEIELSRGLNVLIGPNNCGKSAVISALEGVASNPSSAHAVRHGAKEAKVTIITDDDQEVTWIRRKTGSSYIINGKRIDRIGRGQLPDGLHELLRLPVVDMADVNKKVNIHFARQKEPIFDVLYDESAAASFFASSSDAALLLEMQSLHRTKVSDNKKTNRRLTDDITRLDAEEARYKPVEAIQRVMERVHQDFEKRRTARKAVEDIRQLLDQLSRSQQKQSTLTHRKGVYTTLSEPPKLKDTAPLATTVSQIEKMQRAQQYHRNLGASFEPLKTPPDLYDTAMLHRLREQIASTQERRSKLLQQSEQLAPLSEPPELVGTTRLREMITLLKKQSRHVDMVRLKTEVYTSIKPVPEVADPALLQQSVKQLELLVQQRESILNKLKQMDSKIEENRQQFAAYISEHPHCPTCGTKLTSEALEAGGHAHD